MNFYQLLPITLLAAQIPTFSLFSSQTRYTCTSMACLSAGTSGVTSTQSQIYEKESKYKQNFEKASQAEKVSPSKKEPFVQQEFLNFDEASVEYYTGPNLIYYKEYRAYQVKKGLTSCPIVSCDPIPIQVADDGSKYFFPSAVEGRGYGVSAVEVTNAHYTKIYVVRARSSNGHWAQIYFGYDPTQYKLIGYNGCKKIYNVAILMIQVKDTKDPSHVIQRFPSPSDVRYLKKQKGKDLTSHDIYWTAEENRLKGIVYKSKQRFGKRTVEAKEENRRPNARS